MVFLILLDHTKIWLSIVTALTFSYFRDLHVVYTILGAITTTLIAKTLKRVIRQPRPSETPTKTKNSNYGMPSTHSSCIMFFASYISLHIFANHLDLPAVLLLLLILLTTALSVVWSRVELGHHTKAQVIAGMLLGCFWGWSWDAGWRIWWSPWLASRDLHEGLNGESLLI
ncbi:hypothetical protein G9A89_014758 [Geosiphon pyriformis]|nr:hypothetical protein G9A89_014758 [Geosiphon pyriformis]